MALLEGIQNALENMVLVKKYDGGNIVIEIIGDVIFKGSIFQD